MFQNKCSRQAVYVVRLDASTGERLPSVFTMTSCDDTLCRQTDACGAAMFCIKRCTMYALTCEGDTDEITVCINNCGTVFADGRAICGNCIVVCDDTCDRRYCFTAKKIDISTGEGLPGAEFTLHRGGEAMQAAISCEDGSITFSGLCPGQYTLVETAAPAGYQTNTNTYDVLVTQSGEVLIDGESAQCFVLPNIKNFHLIFKKVAANVINQ